MKTLFCAAIAALCTTAAYAADPITIYPAPVAVVRSPVDVVVPVLIPAEPPRAVLVERITMFSLLNSGWTPVNAAIIPQSGVPGSHGAFAHVNGSAVRLYKQGVYADCGIAQVGGIYNDCRIVTPGTP